MPIMIEIDPVALSFGGLHIRWYGIVVALAATVAVWVAMRGARHHGINPDQVADLVVWLGIGALLGARALYLVQNDLDTLAAHPLHVVMVWDGGLSFYGGLAGGLVALLVMGRRRALPLLALLDVVAPAAALGQAIGHVGCLIGGDSYGTPSGLPWAVVYRHPDALAPLGIPLHPVQAYETALLGLLFAGLWFAREPLARWGSGAMAGAYLLGLAVIRFGLFYLRDEPSVLLGLKVAQLAGLLVAALGLVLLVVAWRSSRTPGSRAARMASARSPRHAARTPRSAGRGASGGR